MKIWLALILCITLLGCQSTQGAGVRVGSTYPTGNCKELGQVIGNANSRDGAEALAMEDLRHNAALKSGNYVRVVAKSAHGTSVRGIAFRCY
ncbi:MAG: DUF4156 domain-containing protein [Bdellovibrionales bacterium]|nr:DUF4156 domain-containing protein [Bdellovibrionales bacterium]